MNQHEHHARPVGKASAYREGFTAPWHGLTFMLRQPGLWRYGIAPILINIVITGLMLILLIGLLALSGTKLHPWFAQKGYALYWELLAFLAVIIMALGFVLAFWKLLEGILCGYFYEKLARIVELQIGTPPADLKETSFREQMIDSVKDAASLAAINLGFLTLSCVPVIGSVAGVCGALYVDSWILGSNFLAFPRGLRGDNRSEIRDFCRSHRLRTLGLGTAVLLFSLLPVVGAVLLTTAVTGTVLLHHRVSGGGDSRSVGEFDS